MLTRHRVAIVLVLVWAAVAPAEEKPPTVADPDLARLLGSWQVVRFEDEGKEKPDRVPFKIRFTPNVFLLIQFRMEEYRLNSAATPKQMDYGLFRADTTAIYELDGDVLKICLNTSPRDPRPTDFTTAPDNGHTLLFCKRVKPPAATVPGPLSQVEPALTARLGEMVGILETEGIAGFMNKCVSPNDEDRFAEDQRAEIALNQTPQEQRVSLLEILRAAQRMNPQLNANKSSAVYELTGVHIESDSAMNLQELKLTKADGQWYVMER